MQTQYLGALKEHSNLSKADRVSRLRRLPLKTVFPIVLRFTRRTYRSVASTFFGRRMCTVLPEPVSVAIWRYGVFEQDVCFYFMSILRPGDTCIDVGGHFGFFSLLGRELVGAEGTVVTFEPMPNTRAILKENMNKHAGPSKHRLISAAAGASLGQLKFKDFGLTGSAFSTSATERSAAFRQVGEINVDVRTVDSVVEELGLTSLRLMKIDAENAEYEVIQGSLKTIRSLRPAIILEAGDSGEASTRGVVDVLAAEGYEPYEFCEWSIRSHAVTETYGYQNLLMIPTEKTGEMLATS